jgi:hypothetical protein
MISDDSEGREVNIEMLTTRTSISEGEMADLARSFAMLSLKKSSISEIASFSVEDASRPSMTFLGT